MRLSNLRIAIRLLIAYRSRYLTLDGYEIKRPERPVTTVEKSKSFAADDVSAVVEAVYLTESRRVFATLVRILGDFDLAEDALHDAFAVALEKWPGEGVPRNPRAWLISAGRFKAIDVIRRRARLDASLPDIAEHIERNSKDWSDCEDQTIEDDRLRLIFICCHPALSQVARVALTLREVCGLKTEEIARAYITSTPTIGQRIVRARARIRQDGIPYQLPGQPDLPERLDAVLQVVYLVFNEGYSATSGDSHLRPLLSTEAIRLGRLLVELLPEPEVMGLLALMLLNESRRESRTSLTGDPVLLADQDRSLWRKDFIEEGIALVERSLVSKRFGPYTLQAAISAVHAEAKDCKETDWAQIVALYTVLMRIDGSPVVALNRAVAIAMRDGPEAGLTIIDSIIERGDLNDYHLAYSARADMLRRLGRYQEARTAYERALALTHQLPERRFFERRLAELL